MWVVKGLAWLVFLATSLTLILTAVDAIRMLRRLRRSGLGVEVHIPPRLLVAWLVSGIVLVIL